MIKEAQEQLELAKHQCRTERLTLRCETPTETQTLINFLETRQTRVESFLSILDQVCVYPPPSSTLSLIMTPSQIYTTATNTPTSVDPKGYLTSLSNGVEIRRRDQVRMRIFSDLPTKSRSNMCPGE
jgi:hypothetical protein